jgi:hypothetical protein
MDVKAMSKHFNPMAPEADELGDDDFIVCRRCGELRRRVEDHCCDHRAAGDVARVKAPQRASRPRSAFGR